MKCLVIVDKVDCDERDVGRETVTEGLALGLGLQWGSESGWSINNARSMERAITLHSMLQSSSSVLLC